MDVGIYQTIAEEIGTRIASGELRPGDKIPSAQSLRKQYGISHITAVRVYGELRDRSLIEQRSGRGYFVSNGRRKKEAARHGMIASFVRPLRAHSGDNYFNEINLGFQRACLERCFNLLSCHTARLLSPLPVGAVAQKQLQEAMLELAPRVDGMLLDERISDDVISEVLRLPGVPPMVLLNRYSPLVDCVLPPIEQNMMELARLAERFGYRKFLYLESGIMQL
jgi:DNA-binding transcriptional regulator YhcF (GntR family)